MKKLASTPNWQRTLGSQIFASRKRRGLSRAVVAKGLGVSVEMVRQYEAGESPPTLEKMRRIVALLEEDFVVDGCQIGRQTLGSTRLRGKRARQTNFDFRNEYLYKRATIRAVARRNELTIRAQVM